MSDKPLRVAVVGAGHMGRHHVRVYSQLDGCELVAVVDRDLDRARKYASEFGGEAFAAIDDVPGDLDAATVAVPTVYHADVAIPLMERGTAVLVEKPLAHNAVTAKQLVDASKRTGQVMQVGHSERFNPIVQAMLKMNVTPQFIETQRVSPFTFRSADIGVVFDMMIHDIDIVLHLVRQCPKSVDASGVAVLGNHEDVANARIRFAGGAVANLTASRLALKTERRLRIFCPSAYLSMDYQAKTGVAIKLADNLDLIRMAKERNFDDLSQMASLDFGSMIKVDPIQVDDTEPLKTEIATFLDSVRTGTGTGVTADEGYAAVELAERITKQVAEEGWGDALTKEAGQPAPG
jgi:predicted dehydrogenase